MYAPPDKVFRFAARRLAFLHELCRSCELDPIKGSSDYLFASNIRVDALGKNKSLQDWLHASYSHRHKKSHYPKTAASVPSFLLPFGRSLLAIHVIG